METIPYELLTQIAQDDCEVYWKLALAHLAFGIRARQNRLFWMRQFGVLSHIIKCKPSNDHNVVTEIIVTHDNRFKSALKDGVCYKVVIAKTGQQISDHYLAKEQYDFDPKLGMLEYVSRTYRQLSNFGNTISQKITVIDGNIIEERVMLGHQTKHNRNGAADVRLKNGEIIKKMYYMQGFERILCDSSITCAHGDNECLRICNGQIQWNVHQPMSVQEKTILEDLEAIKFVPKSVDEWVAKSWN
jgi:hypothetical protein